MGTTAGGPQPPKKWGREEQEKNRADWTVQLIEEQENLLSVTLLLHCAMTRKEAQDLLTFGDALLSATRASGTYAATIGEHYRLLYDGNKRGRESFALECDFRTIYMSREEFAAFLTRLRSLLDTIYETMTRTAAT